VRGRFEQGRAYGHRAECREEGRAYEAALGLLEELRHRLPDGVYQAKRLMALRGSGNTAHNADDNATCVARHTAALAIARATGDRTQEAIELVNQADASWGCGDYGEALRTYRKAVEVATEACYTLARGLAQLGRGIVLWSLGRHAEAARDLDAGLEGARDVGDAWWIAYGLTYRANVHASGGDLSAARRLSQEALSRARASGVGYPLSLAWMHALWQEEVVAPGHPDHAPQIEQALRQTRRLGLHGLALYLSWVRLLHRVADATVPDGALAAELAAALQAYRERAPLKGAWEVLALQVSAAVRERRPAIGLVGLEALTEDVVRKKAESLPLEERQAFRESRRRWVVGG
jgi:tetratricopeptide (TPR) repeat protein